MTLPILLILGLLTAFAPLAIDLYLPSFPALADVFGVSVERVQSSLAAYFSGLAVGQLIHGPFADRFGRRWPLLIGSTLFSIASLACAYAPSIEWMNVARFFQALGGCAGMVVSRAIVRDLCDPLQSAKVFSQLMLIMGVAPILAPVAGGWLLTALGWQSIFVVLAGFGTTALLVVWFGLPETSVQRPLSLNGAFGGYIKAFRDPALVGYGLAGGCGIAGMFAYIAGSPFVFMELYGVTPSNYGWLFGLNAAGFILSAQFNGWLLRRHGPAHWLSKSVWIYLGVACALVAVASLGIRQLWPLMILLFLANSSLACILPNATACALAGQGERAGTASAVMGFLQFAVAANAASLVTFLHDGSARPMTWVIAASALAALLLTLLTRLKTRREPLEF